MLFIKATLLDKFVRKSNARCYPMAWMKLTCRLLMHELLQVVETTYVDFKRLKGCVFSN